MEFKSIIQTLLETLEKNPTKKALFYQDNNRHWKGISFGETKELIFKTAKSMLSYGIVEGSNVAIFSQNMPQWSITDFAIQMIHGVSVPIYPTVSTTQTEYIIHETQASLIFVGEQEQYDKTIELISRLNCIKKIVVFDENVQLKEKNLSVYYHDFIESSDIDITDEVVISRIKKINPDDILTIIYTSGTTGEPKGVMLSHECFSEMIRIHKVRLSYYENDVSLCFLPLSHIFERGWTTFILINGMQNYFLKNPKEIIVAVSEVKPTLLCAVPRFFEKTYSAVFAQLDKFPPFKKKIFLWAIKTGTEFSEKNRLESGISVCLKIRYFFADFLVLKKGRSVFGGRIRYIPCAGAALKDEINKFFHAVGINVKYGYGLTETSATVSCFEDIWMSW